MNKLLMVFSLSLLASCGNDMYIAVKPFDDSTIQTKLDDHESRITALEQLTSRVSQLETTIARLEDKLDISLDSLRDDLSAQLDNLSSSLTSDIQTITNDLVTLNNELKQRPIVISLCNSEEKALKTDSGIYPVMSTLQTVSGQQLAKNVHLGKLKDGNYMLTDGTNVTFSVVNENIVNCSNQ